MGIDIDPLETIEELREDSEEHKHNARLNGAVAITVAILATFLGICNVKDDNIVQAMQVAQADKIDLWNFFQARNIREEVALATIEQMTLDRNLRPEGERAAHDAAILKYQAIAKNQNVKKEDLKTQAEKAQKDYDSLNYRDDQFDLAEASIAIAIALLAVTALTHLWWLFWLASIPSLFGVAIGLAGLFGWAFHPDLLIHPLT
jgi:uncharacterized protein DUF4337